MDYQYTLDKGGMQSKGRSLNKDVNPFTETIPVDMISKKIKDKN